MPEEQRFPEGSGAPNHGGLFWVAVLLSNREQFGGEPCSPAERTPNLQGGTGTRSSAPSVPSPRGVPPGLRHPAVRLCARLRRSCRRLMPESCFHPRLATPCRSRAAFPARVRGGRCSTARRAGRRGGGGERGREFPQGFAGAAERGCSGCAPRGARGARFLPQLKALPRLKWQGEGRCPSAPGAKSPSTGQRRRCASFGPPHPCSQAQKVTKVSTSPRLTRER